MPEFQIILEGTKLKFNSIKYIFRKKSIIFFFNKVFYKLYDIYMYRDFIFLVDERLRTNILCLICVIVKNTNMDKHTIYMNKLYYIKF